MSLTIALKPHGPPRLFQGASGGIAPSGAVSFDKVVNITTQSLSVGGSIAPGGSVDTLQDGPSFQTIIQDLLASINPQGAVATDHSGVSLETLTELISGAIAPTGAVVESIDPFTVTIKQTLNGKITPGTGTCLIDVLTITVPKLMTGQIQPTSTLVTQASGPSFVTIPKTIGGSITPAAGLSNSTSGPSITTVPQSVDGTITPAAALTTGIDPFTVKVLKSVGGTIAPGATIAIQSNGTVTKNIAGTITPAAAVAKVQGGPSFVTVPKSVAGSITQHGAITNVVVPPPITFFSKDLAATITPSSVVSNVVSGPSLVTVSKLVAGGISPTSVLSKVVSGPSFVTVPKSLGGAMSFTGVVTTKVSGPSFVTILKGTSGGITPAGAVSSGSFVTQTKSLGGSITPASALGSSVGGGVGTTVPQAVAGQITPIGSISNVTGVNGISTNPMFIGMGQWGLSDFDRPPQWHSGPYDSTTPTEILNLLSLAKARGYRLVLNVAGSRTTWSDVQPDGTLKPNPTKYQSQLDRYNTVLSSILPYIADGTLAYIMVADEPQIAAFGTWFTPDLRKDFCQRTKTKFPGCKTTIRAPYNVIKVLPTGGWGTTLDAGWSTYVTKQQPGKTYLQYWTGEYNSFQAMSPPLSVIIGYNWLNGGDGSSGVPGPDDTNNTLWLATPQELRAVADASVQMPNAVFLLGMYTNCYGGVSSAVAYQQYQDAANYQSAFAYMRDTGLARGASVTPPTYYTDTNPHAPVYPPPTIPVGGALRDKLTDHKVFHLIDGARLQNSEYPALNSDNSRIYYVQGTAGTIADVTWNIGQSIVQLGNVRAAFDVGFAGVADGVIWDRGDRRFLYYLSGQASLKIYKKNTNSNVTVVFKDIGADPLFVSVWGAQASTLLGSDLHASRSQERFVGIVGNGLGVFVWDRLNLQTWTWKAPTGKTIVHVTIDDISQLVKSTFSDNTWQISTLDVLGKVTHSAVQTTTDPPLREDNQTNKMWQSSGVGVKRWAMSPPDSAGTLVYTNPLKSGKTDVFSLGRVSLQAVDEIVYSSLMHGASLTTPWKLASGEVYVLDWNAEQLANPNKLVPEEVRQGTIHLTKV